MFSLTKRKVGETVDPTLVEDPVEQRSAFTVLMSDAAAQNKLKSKGVTIAQLESKIRFLKKDPSDFDPEEASWWEKGEAVPFKFLCLAFDLILFARGGRSVIDILCKMLRTVIATTPEDLASNEIAPAHEDVKLRIDDVPMIVAVSESFGQDVTEVEARFEKWPSLGLVAEEYAPTIALNPEALTVVKVFNTFKQIAKETAEGNTVTSKDQLKSLLQATTDSETFHLTRLLQGKTKLGFTGFSVLTALGRAAAYNEEQHSKPYPDTENPLKEAGKIVRQVLRVYDIIVRALLTGGVWNLLKACNFTPGFNLGCIHYYGYQINSVGEILDIFKDTDFTCEYKYDGQPAQLHYMEDGAYEIFCCGAKRNTGMFTDVLTKIKEALSGI